MRSIIALLLLSFACQAADEPNLPTLIVSDSGYSWMIQDANGNPVIYKFAQVIVLGKKQPPVVVTPPIQTEFGLEGQVKQWLLTVADSAKPNAKEIAKALKDAAEEFTEYETLVEMETALGITIKSVIKEPKEWRSFGAALFASMETLKLTGKVTTPKDMSRALLEVVKGMQ